MWLLSSSATPQDSVLDIFSECFVASYRPQKQFTDKSFTTAYTKFLSREGLCGSFPETTHEHVIGVIREPGGIP